MLKCCRSPPTLPQSSVAELILISSTIHPNTHGTFCSLSDSVKRCCPNRQQREPWHDGFICRSWGAYFQHCTNACPPTHYNRQGAAIKKKWHMIDRPFVTFDFSRLKRVGMNPLSSSSSCSSQSQFVIDPVCSGRVKSRCLSSSHEERKGRTAVWLGGGGGCKWRRGKKSSVLQRRRGRGVQWRCRAPSTQSFDLSGNEFRAKGCHPAPEMVGPSPSLCLSSVVPHKLPFKCQHLLSSSLPSSTLILSFYICKRGGRAGYTGSRMNIWSGTKRDAGIYL